MNRHHYFYISIGLFLFSSFTRPTGENGFNWGDVLFHAMGLPIWSNEVSLNGLHIPKDIRFDDDLPWPVEFRKDQDNQPYLLEPGKQSLHIEASLSTKYQSLSGAWSNMPLIFYYSKNEVTLRDGQPIYLP